MAKLTLVRKSDVDVPEHLLQKVLERLMDIERAGFADILDTARGMWREYRELVETPDFPEPFRAAYIEEHDGEPPDDPAMGLHGEDALAQDFRERTLPSALEIARCFPLPAAAARALLYPEGYVEVGIGRWKEHTGEDD